MKFSKSLWMFAVAAMCFASCKHSDSNRNDAAAKTEAGSEVTSNETNTPAKMQTASFNIEGMTCAMGCAKTIESKLSKMDGVEKAAVDFEKKTATVEFDANKQTPETLVKTVEAAADGKTYKVSNVKSSGDHAALFMHEKEKEKNKKKSTKDAKSCAPEAKDGKPACCSAKKHCSADEKKA